MVASLAWLGHNAVGALARRNIDVDFSFLLHTAGFEIPFRLIPWDSGDSYGYALLVAGLNTLLASLLGIAGASALGLVLALMRLSLNPLARLVSRGVIELVRNTPQLLQIVFWYFAVLQALPGTRASLALGSAVFLNVRGLFLPAPASGWFGGLALASLLLLGVLPLLLRRWAWALRGTGAALLLLGLAATDWTLPALRGFNFAGGWRLPPELLALSLGTAIYTSAFIAENVRASIAAIGRGQMEAARSLGLSPGRTMRLVILPQAMRTLLPPLTSQYLNVIKSTTLGAAIAYPEILQVYARTVLNQSGRAVEVMTLVLGVFLAVNLSVSAAMNRWDRRLARQAR
ncbi:MAG: amino acid ABC transporter permease [Janthinobacterium lividum]